MPIAARATGAACGGPTWRGCNGPAIAGPSAGRARWQREPMPKIEVKRVRAPMTINDMEPHWIADVDYGAFEVSIRCLRGVCSSMILKRKDANLSKPWKVSQKLFLALWIKLENNGRVIGTDLAPDCIAHFPPPFLRHVAR
jgi:hypothetical protein